MKKIGGLAAEKPNGSEESEKQLGEWARSPPMELKKARKNWASGQEEMRTYLVVQRKKIALDIFYN